LAGVENVEHDVADGRLEVYLVVVQP
jgi:hypothetical protein